MKKIQIWTDGACSPNPGKGGYGIIIRSDKLKKELSGGYEHTTNNRMELLSVIKAIEFLNKNTKSKQFDITIYSDSKYVTDAFNKGWINSWKVNGFKKNADLWQLLVKEILNHRITWQWVKGHNGHIENERCDKLAVLARMQNNLKIDKGYVEA